MLTTWSSAARGATRTYRRRRQGPRVMIDAAGRGAWEDCCSGTVRWRSLPPSLRPR